MTIIVMLVTLSIVSFFTGFRVKFLPYKICPVIFLTSAILILYLILVGTFAFWRQDQTMAEESKLLPDLCTAAGILPKLN